MEGQFFTCPFSMKSTTIQYSSGLASNFDLKASDQMKLVWKWNHSLYHGQLNLCNKAVFVLPQETYFSWNIFTVSWTKASRDEEVLSCMLGGKWEHHITVLFISISASVPVFFSLHLTTNEKAIHFQKINVPHKKVNTAHLQSFRAVEWNVIVTRCLGSLLIMDVFEQPWKMVHFSWHPQSLVRGVAPVP